MPPTGWLGSALRWDYVSDRVEHANRRLGARGVEDLQSSRPSGLTHCGKRFARFPNGLDPPLGRIAGLLQQRAADEAGREGSSYSFVEALPDETRFSCGALKKDPFPNLRAPIYARRQLQAR